MQRQSLGSPASKSQLSGGVAAARLEQRQNEAEEKEIKGEKQIWWSSKADRSIHLIPLLTLFCILVLFFFSRDPSPKEIEAFGGGLLIHGSKVPREVSASAIHAKRGLKAALRNRKLGARQIGVARELLAARTCQLV